MGNGHLWGTTHKGNAEDQNEKQGRKETKAGPIAENAWYCAYLSLAPLSEASLISEEDAFFVLGSSLCFFATFFAAAAAFAESESSTPL